MWIYGCRCDFQKVDSNRTLYTCERFSLELESYFLSPVHPMFNVYSMADITRLALYPIISLHIPA